MIVYRSIKTVVFSELRWFWFRNVREKNAGDFYAVSKSLADFIFISTGIFQFSNTSWGWYPGDLNVIQITPNYFEASEDFKMTTHMLIELWHVNSKRIKLQRN